MEFLIHKHLGLKKKKREKKQKETKKEKMKKKTQKNLSIHKKRIFSQVSKIEFSSFCWNLLRMIYSSHCIYNICAYFFTRGRSFEIKKQHLVFLTVDFEMKKKETSFERKKDWLIKVRERINGKWHKYSCNFWPTSLSLLVDWEKNWKFFSKLLHFSNRTKDNTSQTESFKKM